MKIFALHQPVAMDLRLVLSSVSINDYFELIGDFVTQFAARVIDTPLNTDILNRTKLKELSTIISQAFAKVLDSIVMMDEKIIQEIFEEEGNIIIYGDFEAFGPIQKYLEENNFEILNAEFERIPGETKELTEEQMADIEKLLGKLEEDEDVTNVFHNMKD